MPGPGGGGGVSAPRGVPGPGGVPGQGGLLWGGVCSRGVCSREGVGIPACIEAEPPPVNRMTNTCKNITLTTTSLRPVTMPKIHTLKE